jgi:hypothetical protein
MADDLAHRFAALNYPRDDSDWLEVVRLTRARSHGRPRWALAATAIVAAGAVAATPAFGFWARLVRAFEDAAPAPATVQRSFESLDADAPPGLATHVRSLETRKLILPSGLAIWIAPAAEQGFCWSAEAGSGACDPRGVSPLAPVYSVTGEFTPDGTIERGPVRIDGSTTSESAASAEIHFADGDVATVPVVWVSAPIDAGFFSYEVPPSHWHGSRKPTLLVLRDDAGREIERDASVFTTPSFRAGPSTGIAQCVFAPNRRQCALNVPSRAERGEDGS